MIPVAIYARVSTDQQGDSIDHQISLMKDYMHRMFSEEYAAADDLLYVDEGYSGYYTTILERPAMKRLLEDARAGKFRVVLFKEITRMGRDEEENLKIVRILEASGVRIKSHDGYDSERPESKLLFKISNFMAEVESERISSRVSAGFREKARTGKWPSAHVPFGYRRDPNTQHLVIDESQAEAVRLAFHSYVHDRLGTPAIAERLNAHGYRSTRNNRFQQATVRKMLSNPVYMGDVVYGVKRTKLERVYDDNQNLVKKNRKYIETGNPIIVQEAHPAIVDRSLFNRTQELLCERSTKTGMPSNRVKYPLAGLLYCARCGAGMVTIQSTKPGQKKYRYRYYKCGQNHKYGRAVCVHEPIPAEELEQAVFRLLMDELARAQDSHPIHSYAKAKSGELAHKYTALEEERKKLLKKQMNIIATSDLLEPDMLRELLAGLKDRIDAVTQQMKRIQKQMIESGQTENQVYTLGEVLAFRHALVGTESHQTLRVFFHRLVKRVEVYDRNTVTHLCLRFSY
ncbi:DNA invertase Pin-like site-specific DNA recombinase [Aneurinibacillus soli]|uniref:Transposon gamma-delta resolvase n=1 Tax=Aneurinibacillus soli TaxID=1500254 RepID=A0A0U5B2I2_9BACL|nr:recombinase family protein [Aneurinibacillus soli]PYE57403.1 DNA invertase Pin-like site-specific DNA recombinase [Aneurinibacillus soli]BAU28802.1 Transposon gamma-delta resolvase [Aneurinibacillus soli]